MHVVDSTEEAAAFLRWASERKVIAFDTETTGLDPRAPGFHVRLCQFGDALESWVMPFREWRGTIIDFFRRFQGTLLLHNARYDIAAMRSEGVKVPWARVVDTMVACRLAESNKPAGLKPAAGRHVAGGAAVAQRDLATAMTKNGWGWDTVPLDFPPYVLYAGMDPILTYRLWEVPIIQDKGVKSPVFSLEMAMLEICSGMSDNGMRIDIDYCVTEAAKLRSLTSQIRDQAKEVYGLTIGSPQELGRWFIGQGANLTERTSTGQVSVAKEQLQALLIDPTSSDHVKYIAAQTLRYRKADKMAGSYLENFIDKADSEHMLHADIETLAAKTGRMSIRNPALQTLPKPSEDPESRLVRKSVIPWCDDHVLISADFEQIEMRIAASLSQDEKLIEAFAIADSDPSADFFAEMGKIVHHDPGFTKADPRRKPIKNTMYGMLYGAGPAKIAATAHIPFEQARDARAAILSGFPGLSRAMGTYEREVKTFGHVTTLMGREIQVDPNLAYKGLNAMIQASAADFFKRSVLYLAHAGFDTSMIVPVHDEVVFSIPATDLAEAQAEIRKAMLIDDLSVVIPAEPSDGLHRWAEDA